MGPVYGSVLYDIWGQAVPFMALAVIILITIGKLRLRFCILKYTQCKSIILVNLTKNSNIRCYLKNAEHRTCYPFNLNGSGKESLPHFRNTSNFLCCLSSVLQLIAFQSDEQHERKDHSLPSMGRLLLDPYIIIVADM